MEFLLAGLRFVPINTIFIESDFTSGYILDLYEIMSSFFICIQFSSEFELMKFNTVTGSRPVLIENVAHIQILLVSVCRYSLKDRQIVEELNSRKVSKTECRYQLGNDVDKTFVFCKQCCRLQDIYVVNAGSILIALRDSAIFSHQFFTVLAGVFSGIL